MKMCMNAYLYLLPSTPSVTPAWAPDQGPEKPSSHRIVDRVPQVPFPFEAQGSIVVRGG
jgi:hypothetical protein